MNKVEKMYKYICTSICSLLLFVPVFGQINTQTMKVLDNCAAAIKKCGNIKATFTATQFTRQQEQGATNGVICVSGNKLYIDGGATKIWYDGKTQWSYNSSTQEVNISTPSKAEAARINPYSFIYIYKQGYNATMSDANVRGKNCYDVRLTSNVKKSLRYVYLTIDKTTSLPICIRMSSNGTDWTRISIYEISKKQKFNAEIFRFNAKDFPHADVIDLR